MQNNQQLARPISNRSKIIIWVVSALVLVVGGLAMVKYTLDKFEQNTRLRIASICEEGKLSTTEYSVSQVLSWNDDQTPWKIGDRKILLSCRAFVEAGVDLTKYNKDKTEINPSAKTITLTLPPVEILSFDMPDKEIKTQYKKVTLFRDEFTPEERNRILRRGEEEIKEKIVFSGILDEARTNAVKFFTDLLVQCGYMPQNIDIRFESDLF